MGKAPRLLYATPTGRNPTLDYVASVRALELTCRSFDRGLKDFAFTTGPVHMARTRIAQLAMDGRCWEPHMHDPSGKGCKAEPYDYVVMHDDDMCVGPQSGLGNPFDIWLKLFEQTPKLGMVGMVYMRERPCIPNVVVQHPKYPEELCHVVAGFPDAPVEVGAIGTGFVMIRTEVLTNLDEVEDADGGPPMFRFPMTPTRWGTIVETGEDYDFCRRVRALGYSVVADPRWKTVHVKPRGPLVYNRPEWEATWQHGMPAALAPEFAEQLHPKMVITTVGGFLVLDHTPVRELDGEAWRQRHQSKAA